MSQQLPNQKLPSSWNLISLREIGIWRGGGTPSKANRAFWTNGAIPWISPKDMKVRSILDAEDHITPEAVKASATSLIDSGSILVVTRSGILSHTLPIAINKVDVAMNQDLKALTPDAGIDSSYVAHALDRFELEILHQCTKTGTTVPSIEFPLLLDFEIPLAPFTEQHRIVAEIEKQFARLDECTAALRRVVEDLRQYRASVLKAACEGRLVPPEAELARAEGRDYEPASVLLKRILAERRARWEADQLARMKAQGKTPKGEMWKEKYEEPEGPATGHLGDLPDGWEWVSVSRIGRVQLGRQRAPQHHQGANMRKYLRVANVFEDRIDLSDVLEMNFEPREFEIYKLDYGDILLNEGQSLELVGRPAMFRGELENACFQNTLVRFRSDALLNRDYALTVFRAYLHTGRFQQIASWTTSIAHLGADRFANMEFPLPPLAEQHRIAAEVRQRLRIADELKELVSVNLKRADELRRSILNRAFEGRLVPQDANDEPASALLERIAAERQRRAEAAMTQKKSPSDKRRKKPLEIELATPLFTEERMAAQPKELLTAFTANESLTVEDLFRHGGYNFDSEDDIDAFFEELTGELEATRLTLERVANGDVFVKRGTK